MPEPIVVLIALLGIIFVGFTLISATLAQQVVRFIATAVLIALVVIFGSRILANTDLSQIRDFDLPNLPDFSDGADGPDGNFLEPSEVATAIGGWQNVPGDIRDLVPGQSRFLQPRGEPFSRPPGVTRSTPAATPASPTPTVRSSPTSPAVQPGPIARPPVAETAPAAPARPAAQPPVTGLW